MAKSDTATCPYCSNKVDIKAGSLRPHLKTKDGDVCDGGGLSVDRLAAPAGVDEKEANK